MSAPSRTETFGLLEGALRDLPFEQMVRTIVHCLPLASKYQEVYVGDHDEGTQVHIDAGTFRVSLYVELVEGINPRPEPTQCRIELVIVADWSLSRPPVHPFGPQGWRWQVGIITPSGSLPTQPISSIGNVVWELTTFDLGLGPHLIAFETSTAPSR